MPPRTYSEEEMEAVRLTEAAIDRRPPEVKASEAGMAPSEGEVKLYHPESAGLHFGPGSGPETTDQQIVFGTIVPHVAIIRADHPLLPALLRSEPSIVVLRPGEKPGRTYACEDCDGEFKSKALLSDHRREAHARKPRAQAPEA